jgi:hypothetical protein
VPESAGRSYVQQLLALYGAIPGVPAHPRRADRILAEQLHRQRVPLSLVRDAFVLALARRTFRSSTASPLAPIATLHYFLPVIEELASQPCEPGYLDYLRHKLASVAPQLVSHVDHQLSRPAGHRLP